MLNINDIQEKNFKKGIRPPLKSNTIIFSLKEKEFSFKELKKVIDFINSAKSHYRLNLIKIYFNIEIKNFVDKLTFVLLEVVFYNLIRQNIHFEVNLCVKTTIQTVGIIYSPIQYIDKYSKKNFEKYEQLFNFDISSNHFRRILSLEKNRTHPENLSIVITDIASFLKHNDLPSENSDNISIVISELVDNALEHSNSDCLVDIDFADNFYKDDESKEEYYVVNTAILCFSPILLGEKVKEVIDNDAVLGNKYFDKLKRILKYHKDKFSEEYTEQDFFILSNFQDRITSRTDFPTGGTGLTKFIKAVEERSYGYTCYVVSGKRTIFFVHDMLLKDSENWVTFNKENNIYEIPDKKLIKESPIFIPGTAYNLAFIFKKEKENERG